MNRERLRRSGGKCQLTIFIQDDDLFIPIHAGCGFVPPHGPGALARVELDCGFPLVVLITKRSAEGLKLETETKVYASFKATAVHTIKRQGD